MFDLKTFDKCIELLSAMVEREKELRIDAKNNGFLAKTNSMLGSEFVTKQLFNGLATSRKAYYKTAEDYGAELNKIADKISAYKSLIATI